MACLATEARLTVVVVLPAWEIREQTELLRSRLKANREMPLNQHTGVPRNPLPQDMVPPKSHGLQSRQKGRNPNKSH